MEIKRNLMNPYVPLVNSKFLLHAILQLVSIAFFIGCSQAGKISASLDTVELSDFRFGLGVPYVTFYENENFRGKLHYARLSLQCTNIEEPYDNWASSVNLHKRCVTICDQKDCKGKCAKLTPSMDPTVKGAMKLKDYGLNDQVSSVKFCY